jgi:hypothetical protein
VSNCTIATAKRLLYRAGGLDVFGASLPRAIDADPG